MRTIPLALKSLCVVLCLVGATTARAQQTQISTDVPRTFSYQGLLSGPNGAPVPDGEYQITVSLYADPTGTVRIWQDTYRTFVTGGVFNIYLGNRNAPLPDPGTMNRALWIGTQVDDGPEMSPLTPLSASPYALNVPDGAITTDKLADAAVTAEKVNMDYIGGIAVNGQSVTGNGTVLNLEGSEDIALIYNDRTNTLRLSKPSPASHEHNEKTTSALAVSDAVWSLNGDGWDVSSGTTVAPASGDWIGTSNNVTFEMRTNNQQVMRYQPSGTDIPNIIGGYSGNSITTASIGSVIAGGGELGSVNQITSSANFAVIGGGRYHTVSATYGVIGGGHGNTVSSEGGFIGGGTVNTVSDRYAFVGGGSSNTASGSNSFVGSGDGNSASGDYATVAGGFENVATGTKAFIGAGNSNSASGDYSVIGGGYANQVSNTNAAIGGGNYNTAAGDHAFIGGGESNSAAVSHNFIGGGKSNATSNLYATIVGGEGNIASNEYSFVGNGLNNTASGLHSFVGNGIYNIASGQNAAVGSGALNHAAGQSAFVGAGENDTATGMFSVVVGGEDNTASAYGSIVGGGGHNLASGSYALVGAGDSNTATGSYSAVVGGKNNTAFASKSAVGGGNGNITAGTYSAIPGGDSLRTTGYAQTAVGFYNASRGVLMAQPSTPVLKTTNDPLFMVGNGTAQVLGGSITRSNAFEVSYNGHSVVYDVNGTSQTVVPGSRAPIKGATYVDNVVYAWGDINANGTINADFGVAAVANTGPGAYTVTIRLNDPQTGPGPPAPVLINGAVTATLTMQGNVAPCGTIVCSRLGNPAANQFQVRTFGPTCSPVDLSFMFHVTGRP